MCRYRIRSDDIAQANYTDTEVQRVEDNLADMLDADFLADSEDGDDGAEEQEREEQEGEADDGADEATEVF
jgi:hypothetical protein